MSNIGLSSPNINLQITQTKYFKKSKSKSKMYN